MLLSILNRCLMNGINSGIVINPCSLICHQDTKTRIVNFLPRGIQVIRAENTVLLKNHLMDHIKSCDGIRLRLLHLNVFLRNILVVGSACWVKATKTEPAGLYEIQQYFPLNLLRCQDEDFCGQLSIPFDCFFPLFLLALFLPSV